MSPSTRVGTIVKYVLPENSSNAGEIRPAIIVADKSNGNDQLVNLQVFTDGDNDGKQYNFGVVHAADRAHDDNKAPGTWHF